MYRQIYHWYKYWQRNELIKKLMKFHLKNNFSFTNQISFVLDKTTFKHLLLNRFRVV